MQPPGCVMPKNGQDAQTPHTIQRRERPGTEIPLMSLAAGFERSMDSTFSKPVLLSQCAGPIPATLARFAWLMILGSASHAAVSRWRLKSRSRLTWQSRPGRGRSLAIPYDNASVHHAICLSNISLA